MKSAAVESQNTWDFDDKMENYDPIIPGVKDYAEDQTLAPTSTSSAAKKTLSPKAIENQKLTKRLGEINTIKKKKANGETLDADEELNQRPPTPPTPPLPALCDSFPVSSLPLQIKIVDKIKTRV